MTAGIVRPLLKEAKHREVNYVPVGLMVVWSSPVDRVLSGN